MDKLVQVDKLSNETIETIFEEAFDEQVGRFNNISGFDVELKRSVRETDILMEVAIMEMAGSPTIADFKGGNVEDASTLHIDSDHGVMDWTLLPDQTASTNLNNYIVVYRLEQ